MSWLFITIFAYFLLAIVALVDKYLLGGLIPNPKIYSFYIGILSILALFLIPLGFSIPKPTQIIISLLTGVIYFFAYFALFSGLVKFEASRIVPAIGGILPLFTFFLTYFFEKEIWQPVKIFSFILLISGSILISFEREKKITLKSLQISSITAFLWALAYFLTKIVYLKQPFWSGFIWIRIGTFLTALFLLFWKEIREEIFKTRTVLKPKTFGIFLSNQAMGAIAFILYNFAVALVPFNFLAFVNALEGTKYLFLLIFTIFLSLRFPQILKEEISKKVLIQKIVAIFLIGIGLAILAFK